MSGTTNITWADASWNPIKGCSHCSPGCEHCYAERMAYRLACMGALGYVDDIIEGRGDDGKAMHGHWTGKTVLVESELDKPLRWRKPRTIFVVSMGDLFHPSVPFGVIDKVYAVMALCPQHRWMCLTKRIDRALEYHSDSLATLRIRMVMKDFWLTSGRPMRYDCGDIEFWEANHWPLPNVAHGVTVCNQAETPKLDVLCQIPGKLWVSIEPMLGPVDITPWLQWTGKHSGLPKPLSTALEALPDIHGLSYVVCGGETGPGARPMHPDWVRKVRDDCKAAGVGFHFKAWGSWWRTQGWMERLDAASAGWDYNERNGGRVLDGREHDGGIAW